MARGNSERERIAQTGENAILFEKRKPELNALVREYVFDLLRKWFGDSFDYSVSVEISELKMFIGVTATIPSLPDVTAFKFDDEFAFGDNTDTLFELLRDNNDEGLIYFLNRIALETLGKGYGKSGLVGCEPAKSDTQTQGETLGLDSSEHRSLITSRMCLSLAKELESKWKIPTHVFRAKVLINETGSLSIVLVWRQSGQKTGFEVTVEAAELKLVYQSADQLIEQVTTKVLLGGSNNDVVEKEPLSSAPGLIETNVRDNIVLQLIQLILSVHKVRQSRPAHQTDLNTGSQGSNDGPKDSVMPESDAVVSE